MKTCTLMKWGFDVLRILSIKVDHHPSVLRTPSLPLSLRNVVSVRCWCFLCWPAVPAGPVSRVTLPRHPPSILRLIMENCSAADTHCMREMVPNTNFQYYSVFHSVVLITIAPGWKLDKCLLTSPEKQSHPPGHDITITLSLHYYGPTLNWYLMLQPSEGQKRNEFKSDVGSKFQDMVLELLTTN